MTGDVAGSVDALFVRTGASTFIPTDAAVSAWDPHILHGAAATALLAGRMERDDRMLARLTVEFLGPVPLAPLALELSEPVGGRRVQRQDAVLTSEGRPVMSARSVLLRRDDLDLPERAVARDTPFDPTALPPLDRLNHAAADAIGRDSFDTRSIYIEFLRVEGDARQHQWTRLAVPVVEGTEILPIENVAVAADYAQSSVHRKLPMMEWSFRNAELTLHLAREPVGTWIGACCDSVVASVGAGYNTATLFDAGGEVARSAASLVVEHRE